MKTMFIIAAILLVFIGCNHSRHVQKSTSEYDSTANSLKQVAHTSNLHEQTRDSSRFVSFADMRSGYLRQTVTYQFAALLSNGQTVSLNDSAAIAAAAGSYLDGLPPYMLNRITGISITTETGQQENQTGSTVNRNSERLRDGRDSLSEQEKQALDLTKKQTTTTKDSKSSFSFGRFALILGVIGLLGFIVFSIYKKWSIWGNVKKKFLNPSKNLLI